MNDRAIIMPINFLILYFMRSQPQPASLLSMLKAMSILKAVVFREPSGYIF